MIKNTRVDKFSTFSTTWKIYLMRQLVNYFLLNSTIYETYFLFWNYHVEIKNLTIQYKGPDIVLT